MVSRGVEVPKYLPLRSGLYSGSPFIARWIGLLKLLINDFYILELFGFPQNLKKRKVATAV